MLDEDWNPEIEKCFLSLQPFFPLKEEKENKIKETPVLEDVHIQVKIDSLQDLIRLANEAKEKYGFNETTQDSRRFNIDLQKLCNIREVLIELDSMIGMEKLKTDLIQQILYYLQDLHHNAEYKHMVLTGPPGVGKTEIAKIVAKLFLKMGVLKNGIFKKATRADLVGSFLGQTAMKTTALIQSCLGGVLFIDEAYSLYDEKQDIYAREAVDTLCEAMSHYREEWMVIIAGYKKETDDFLKMNRGMESRFMWYHHIEQYTPVEMYKIFVKMVKNIGWKLQGNYEGWFQERHKTFKACGRDMEKMMTFAKIAHAKRVYGMERGAMKTITMEDLHNGYSVWMKSKEGTREEKEEAQRHQFYFV
jgi:Holliday junction resolvasome RuvABC ATP-dependent DNA helicase subunit